MIAGFAKSYPQYTFEDILFKISYTNIVLYGSVLNTEFEENKATDTIRADDPKNADLVKKTLYG